MHVAFVGSAATAFAIFMLKLGSVAHRPMIVSGGETLLVNAARLDQLFHVKLAKRQSEKISGMIAFLIKR